MQKAPTVLSFLHYGVSNGDKTRGDCGAICRATVFGSGTAGI
jgi:hypothetical protein